MLASSGRVIKVAPDRSVVQARRRGERGHLREQGVCGTRLTRVIEGEPDHRDLYLTPGGAGRERPVPACCRAPSRRVWCWILGGRCQAVAAAAARQVLHAQAGQARSGLPSPVLKFVSWQRRQRYIFELDISGRMPGSAEAARGVPAWVRRSPGLGVRAGSGRGSGVSSCRGQSRRRGWRKMGPIQPILTVHPSWKRPVNGCTHGPAGLSAAAPATLRVPA